MYFTCMFELVLPFILIQFSRGHPHSHLTSLRHLNKFPLKRICLVVCLMYVTIAYRYDAWIDKYKFIAVLACISTCMYRFTKSKFVNFCMVESHEPDCTNY